MRRNKSNLANFFPTFQSCSLIQGRGELEKERDSLQREIEAAENKIDVLERTLDEMSNRLAGNVGREKTVLFLYIVACHCCRRETLKSDYR